VVLDISSGEGLLGLAALDQVGPGGSVIFGDISRPLLEHCHEEAAALGALDRCRFIQTRAEELSALPDISVDVVVTRSVLIYVSDKQQALREFYRVLRPGGRISCYEPILRHLGYPRVQYWDVRPIQGLADKVQAALVALRAAPLAALLDLDERDLLAIAETAHFEEVYVTLQMCSTPASPRDWEASIRTAPDPLSPTLGEALEQALAPDERARYVAHSRPLVEIGQGRWQVAEAYLWGTKVAS
jgi:arsenite methyltransferase